MKQIEEVSTEGKSLNMTNDQRSCSMGVIKTVKQSELQV